MTGARRGLLAGVLAIAAAVPADGQFRDDFEAVDLRTDPSGLDGWSFFAGDGDVVMDLVGSGEGFASILVDATADRRNVWWALIKRRVSGRMDLAQLGRSGRELRVEARIRVSHAPRRVNLHVNTQRTTDFHSHLMEFDIPVSGEWTTISMTTRDFPVEPGDTVFAQMALMDWGLGRYRVDVDWFRVDVVEAARAGADLGAGVPFHPPVPDAAGFEHAVAAAAEGVVDLANADVNLSEWSAMSGGTGQRVLTAGGTLWTILRFDLDRYRGRRVARHGLLELTTDSLLRDHRELKDAGLVRVVEILGGDAAWERGSLTLESLLRGGALEDVVNPQPIIDWAASDVAGGRTWFVISQPVLQRLVDGRSLGLAVTPLGPISATFRSGGADAPRLLLDIKP